MLNIWNDKILSLYQHFVAMLFGVIETVKFPEMVWLALTVGKCVSLPRHSLKQGVSVEFLSDFLIPRDTGGPWVLALYPKCNWQWLRLWCGFRCRGQTDMDSTKFRKVVAEVVEMRHTEFWASGSFSATFYIAFLYPYLWKSMCIKISKKPPCKIGI